MTRAEYRAHLGEQAAQFRSAVGTATTLAIKMLLLQKAEEQERFAQEFNPEQSVHPAEIA